MRGDAAGLQIRHFRAEQIGDELVQLRACQGADVVPLVGVVMTTTSPRDDTVVAMMKSASGRLIMIAL
jgi:hypothetical protein